MAEVTLAGGLVIDIATREDIDNAHNRLAKVLERPKALIRTPKGTGVVGAGATQAQQFPFDPPSPPAGHIWLVQFSVIAQKAANPLATVANVAASLCRGRCSPCPNNTMAATPAVEVTEIVSPFSGVPGVANIPDRLRVMPQEQLYVLLTGSGIGAAGTIYQAIADVLVIPDTPEALLW